MGKNTATVLIFFGGILSDAFLIGGAVLLVAYKDWSPWWILAGLIVAGLQYPYRFLSLINDGKLPEGGPK